MKIRRIFNQNSAYCSSQGLFKTGAINNVLLNLYLLVNLVLLYGHENSALR